MSESEWLEERNPWGGIRRYRWVDIGRQRVKEYETIVHTAKYGTIPQSELKNIQERKMKDESENVY